jgi:hypothetical protein
VEHQEEPGHHKPAPGGDKGSPLATDRPAPGESTEVAKEALVGRQVIRARGDLSPLLAGR